MGRYLSRLGMAIAVSIVALFIAIIAIVFLCIGLYHMFGQVTSQSIAAFLTGACALLVALLTLGVAKLLTRRPVISHSHSHQQANPAAELLGGGASIAGGLGQVLARELSSLNWTIGHTIATAVFLGFGLGASSRLRHSLWNMLKRSLRSML